MDLQKSSALESGWSVTVQDMGRSVEGRPLQLLRFRPPHPRHRVLVVAGQHGDEHLGMEVVEALARETSWLSRFPDMELALVGCINPDGRARRQRENASGIDLNRDHQKLHSPEIRALHRFCRDFQSDLVVDVHTFPARRRTLLAHGLEIGEEVMLEISNHPMSLPTYQNRKKDFLDPLLSRLQNQNIRAARYVLAKPSGRVRTSSSDVVDARNALALIDQTETLLLEGRQPTRSWGSRQRTRQVLRCALLEALELWRVQGSSNLECPRKPGDAVFLGARRVSDPGPIALSTLGPTDAEPRVRPLPGRAQGRLHGTDPVELPVAYGVPRNRRALLSRLKALGFEARADRRSQAGRDVGEPTHPAVEELTITSARISRRPGRGPRNLTVERSRVSSRGLDDHILFDTEQPRGEALALLLEPQSRYGLHREAEMEIPALVGQIYPILRILGPSGRAA